MNNKISVLTTTLLLLFNSPIFADGGYTDFFRSTGKIYVVVAVLVVIFIGIIFYLIRLDNKISKLEKRINQ